ncbi:MmgE/PrpD family protein [Natronomonas sp.]|uniref:MmgE/PrpD family protein n=1 Tax=Natronomonas sp. TaxID=2184060 RepID=UPI002631633F|nr:MmgE/PrpD family protein [Natronomonas sp.]
MSSSGAIAEFAADVRYERLPEDVRAATKRRVLDAVGVGLGTRETGERDAIARAVGGGGSGDGSGGESRLWGATTASAPMAALHNAALAEAGNGAVFLSPALARAYGPLGAVLAAAETEGSTGDATLAGLAVALEVHGELAWSAPLEGFGPATHAGLAAAAGVGRAMGLGADGIERAIGLTASRVSLSVGGEAFRPVSSGLASQAAVVACRLAAEGVEAPDAMTAAGGWHDRVGAFDLDLDPGCERVRDAAVLPYDAHPYGQSAIEAAIGLAEETAIDPADIGRVGVETVERAVPEVDAERIAAALVDRALAVHRAGRADLRPVAERVTVSSIGRSDDRPDTAAMPARVTVETRDGATHERAVERFSGHPAAPASWGTVEGKFHAQAAAYDRDRREDIVRTVRSFEAETAVELARLLGRARSDTEPGQA